MSRKAGAGAPEQVALSEHLQNLTEALAAAQTQEEVFDIILEPALEALDAVAGAILLVSGDEQSLKIAATKGHEEGAQTIWQDGPLSGNVPAGDALLRREALYFEHQGALTRAYPQLEQRTGAVAAVATTVLPMFLEEVPLGVIVLDFKEPHRFTPGEQRFLRTLAAQGAVALGRARLQATLEERVRSRTAQIEEEARSQVAFAKFTELVGRETDIPTLCRKAYEVMDTRFSNYSSVYYELEGEFWKARVWTPELPPELVEQLRAGLPANEPALTQALQSREPVFIAGQEARHGRQTNGAVASICLYPLLIDGAVRGIFTVDLHGSLEWSLRDRALMLAIGRSLNLALERSEQARQLEAERTALDAFVAYSELVGTENDLLVLAQRAVDVLQVHFQDCSGGYYGWSGASWSLRTWTEDLNARPELLASLRVGLPSENPSIARLLHTREPIFTEAWSADKEGIEDSEVYGAVGAYPVLVSGVIQGFIALGLKNTAYWQERDRAIFRSVGRGLALALERAEQTWQLAEQNAELEARSRALEGFSTLLGDLSLQTEPLSLIQSALEMVMTLLPPGHAAFWERRGQRWYAAAQTLDGCSPELQRVMDAGLQFGQAPSLDTPYHTHAPFFQDVYVHGLDTPPEVVSHINAVATLPVMVRGEVLGILNVPLFGERRWSKQDRAVLETAVRSLGLALERAEGVISLARRTEELARSNAELEQFAYIASHDLQAPIRAVTSFAGIINRKYGEVLDERGQLYLKQIVDSGEHMKRLVDDLLAFSRVHTQQRDLQAVDSARVCQQVVSRLELETGDAAITCGELPPVLADPQQLDQLLQNLIANGLKYQRPGVTPQVHVSAKAQGKLWEFAVQDNGIGIEPQYFGRIFEIFQRLHSRETYEGTGIGLAVCKKIVERHGGQLWLESTPGEGSTFFFTLPGVQAV